MYKGLSKYHAVSALRSVWFVGRFLELSQSFVHLKCGMRWSLVTSQRLRVVLVPKDRTSVLMPPSHAGCFCLVGGDGYFFQCEGPPQHRGAHAGSWTKSFRLEICLNLLIQQEVFMKVSQ